MTNPAGHPPPLPIRVRPTPGENAESYVHRLARANHLRPSLLRRYLARTEGGYGPIRADLLAILTGRTLPAIYHALPDLAPPPPKPPVHRPSELDKQRGQAARRALFAAIREDLDTGMSGRAIERNRNVSRRTVQRAALSPTPPARKKIDRPPVALNGLHEPIDAMIKANHQIPVSAIWEHLADDLGVTVSYGALRAYVHTRRPALRQHSAH